MAHVHYVLREYPAAAKIYIDELHRPESNLSRETLINSLKLVLQHKGHFESQLEEYFDTPRHALIVVNLLADFDRSTPRDARDVSRTARISRRLIRALQERKQLFREGEESDQLALTLMRCALVAGDPPAVLEFAGRIDDSAGVPRDRLFLDARERELPASSLP